MAQIWLEVLSRYIRGLKARDVDEIAAVVSEDLAFVLRDRTLNKRDFLSMLRSLYAAFPDWHYEHDPPEDRGDVIAVRWRQRGTHTTGKKVAVPPQYFFYKVRGSQIVEIRPDSIPGGAPEGIFDQIRSL